MMSKSPIDPVRAYIGESFVTDEQREKIEEYWGVNKSPTEQYFSWVNAISNGDLGQSKIEERPVSDIIKERFLASFALMGISWVLSGVVGFILGIIAAMNRGKLLDKIIKWYSYIQASVPTYWLGLIFLIIFAVQLKWLPVGIAVPIGVKAEDVTFIDRLRHFILPALTLSVLGIANVTLHTREKMIDVLNSEYVTFAKTRGETSLQILKNHGLRNVILPAVTLHFSYFGELFGGSVLAENVFSYPGLGSTITEAGLKGDLPLLMGVVLFSALFVFTGNMLADIINCLVDPRLKGRC